MDDAAKDSAGLVVQYEQDDEGDPPSPELVRRWLRAALPAAAEVTVRYVSAAASRELNKRYRGKDRPANVLAFPYPDENRLAGDVAICPKVVAAEARAAGIEPRLRHAHLVVHACLHLRGQSHDTPEAAARMEAAESRILAGLGLPDPYEAA